MPKRLLSGVVVSSNSNKTIVVEVTRRVKHKLYKKIIKRSKKFIFKILSSLFYPLIHIKYLDEFFMGRICVICRK